jgi:hypothetical protein
VPLPVIHGNECAFCCWSSRLLELMAHDIHNKKDLHMIQIDFTNAFGSVPHGLIAHNMACLGIPSDQIEIVMKIYEGATTRISVPTGISEPINWRSGTV